MAGFFPRQRRCGFSRNTLNTSEVWSLATTRSLSRVLCCRLLNCCGRKSTRSCLSRTYFDRTELQDDDLRETLAKHAACWTGDSIDPSIAAAEVCRRVTMGSEATAVDQTDAIQSRLELCFENPIAEYDFCDARGTFKRGPAAVISEAFFSRLAPARV